MVNRPLGQLPRGHSPERMGPAARRAQNRRPQQNMQPQLFHQQLMPAPQYYRLPPKRKLSSRIMESKTAVFGAVAAATFGLGYLAMNFTLDWFTTHEQGTINALPPTARVDRYAALVTGTAESSFSIDGSTDCGGVGGIDIHTEWQAVATVANVIGSFAVNVSQDQSQVTINLEQYPELESGLQLDKTQTQSGEDSFWTACNGDDLTKVFIASALASQATADTIGPCIVQRPEFQSGLHDQLQAFGQAAYPTATSVTVNMPQTPELQPESITALDELRNELDGRGVNIVSGPVDNCDFHEFNMTPIVFSLGDQNG